MNGDDAYYAENSSEMVEWMEKALLELYRSLEDCRSDCTSPLKKTTPTLGLSQVSQRGGVNNKSILLLEAIFESS